MIQPIETQSSNRSDRTKLHNPHNEHLPAATTPVPVLDWMDGWTMVLMWNSNPRTTKASTINKTIPVVCTWRLPFPPPEVNGRMRERTFGPDFVAQLLQDVDCKNQSDVVGCETYTLPAAGGGDDIPIYLHTRVGLFRCEGNQGKS